MTSPAEETTLSPAEALRRLATYCAPRFSFTKPNQIVPFVKILISAEPKKGKWDAKDAQKVLEKVTESHGATRIEYILSYPRIASRIQTPDEIGFASTYLGCLSYMVTDFVLDSSLEQRRNLLFGIFHDHYPRFNEVVTICMQDMVSRRSFDGPGREKGSGAAIFNTLSLILIQYLIVIKTALREHSSLPGLVDNLSQWFDSWKIGGFIDGWVPDNEHAKKTTLDDLQLQINRLVTIVQREAVSISRKDRNAHNDGRLRLHHEGYPQHHAALIGPLEIHYDPAGHLREPGPRHDNDFEDIQTIVIPPTQEEMLSPVAPFLPANIPGAPHHLPAESMERLLDIQFRLLREELLAPLRAAVRMVIADLRNQSRDTLLQPILNKKGGLYVAQTGQLDSVMIRLYTSVDPLRIAADKRGISIELMMDTPPGPARNISATRRIEYWRAISRKRLMQGGLIGVIWQTRHEIQLFFGLIASAAHEIQSSVEDNNETMRLRVKFFDPSIHVKVMEWCQPGQRARGGTRILLIEAPVMYESIRPLLQALQREPTGFPFSQYLVHRQYVAGQSMQVTCPRYTITRPDFVWDLRCLLGENQPPLHLDPADPVSITQARLALRTLSRLDTSQAEAMVDCLTREFSLIQGPPGTGKSFTGVEIMRVLLANRVRPILLIAFTNHALDHLLRSVLEAGLTKKIVRLGSRSSDEKIAQFSLENMEKFESGGNTNRSSINEAHWARKNAEAKLNEVLFDLQDGSVSDDHREEYMDLFYPDHQDELTQPPRWIEQLRLMNIGWTEVGSDAAQELPSTYDFWIQCNDILWLRAQTTVQKAARQQKDVNRFGVLQADVLEKEEEAGDGVESLEVVDGHPIENEETRSRNQFLRQAGLTEFPSIPSSNRSIEELQEDIKVWLMSPEERARLDHAWTAAIRTYFFEARKESFSELKAEFEQAQVAYDECQAQARRDILEKADIIGCTTTGAAKLTNLLNGVHPSVLLIEEAGQVLEAHVIGSLVRSIEHVIMIGDPFQLRPTISNYALSMDHPRGKEIYKFDQSTMERLGNSGMPMSLLSVQRRMRPQISSIARRTLYGQLEDHELVKSYPDVRGLAKNMFFFHHTHAEGGIDEESTSKFNTFEVSMIKGLVHYLLRQGSYTKPGSIVVLCMYLGQLAKIRDELREIRINVVLDSRDVDELRSREADTDISEEAIITEVAEVKVTDQVHLRTVDNFQGEEADIVLLSLVRNPGEGQSGSIGFLKSTNRVNVALTRARHGLYVFGNGELLAQKGTMWKQVIQEFKDQDAYGSGLPIACNRHPTEMHWVENATRLRHISPDGGCLRPCDYRLKCGHTCPSKCHSDDEDHLFVRCYERCRILCSKGHPCDKACWMPCGDCTFSLVELALDCGHVLEDAPCYLTDDQSTFKCREQVEKQMPACEHRMVLDCFQDPADVSCSKICNGTMGCCEKPCKSRCGECQLVSSSPGTRDQHKGHTCDRVMHCQHLCPQLCTKDHNEKCGTSDCQGPCRQSCSHHTCRRGCSEPCQPCMEPCPWKCEHHECYVPCGSPCVRLPCDVPCTRVLKCGHKCPSLCGEPCGQQLCHKCANKNESGKVVDLILGLTLSDLDPFSPGLDNITITLQCRHTFTAETLDGLCELTKAYEWEETSESWKRPLLSSENFIKPPCCPTCRTPINAQRYGRVTKRGNLDLLERNIATRMARELRLIQIQFRDINMELMRERTMKSVVTRPDFTFSAKVSEAAKALRQNLTRNASPAILPVDVLNLQAKKNYGLPTLESEHWKKAIGSLLELYQQSLKLTETRTAHSSAYDAAFSMVYERELQRAQLGPRIPKRPKLYALQAAKTKVGMAPPRADTRFRVEAIWISIDIRSAIGSLAEKYFSCLLERPAASNAQRESWVNFTTLIYDSCFHGAQCAIKIARTTNAHRQELLSGLRVFRANWRRAQFEVLVKQARLQGISAEERMSLSNDVEKRLLYTKEAARNLRSRCISNANMRDTSAKDEFDIPLQQTFEHWEELIERLNRPAVFYQAVTDEERLQVVGSFTEYLHRGHWYTCPNGHIFTIADCGGANQMGRCNECGAAIGGTGHQVVAGVGQAVDLERIAEAQGARASPWAWSANV